MLRPGYTYGNRRRHGSNIKHLSDYDLAEVINNYHNSLYKRSSALNELLNRGFDAQGIQGHERTISKMATIREWAAQGKIDSDLEIYTLNKIQRGVDLAAAFQLPIGHRIIRPLPPEEFNSFQRFLGPGFER